MPEFSILLILFAASFIQSFVGFGFGVMAVPLLLWISIPLPEAALIVTFHSFLQTSFLSYKLRDAIPWEVTKEAVLFRLLFIPLGLWGLTYLAGTSQESIRSVVGAFILLSQFAKTSRRNFPGGKRLAFSFSGFLAGLVTMGGPPLVMWVQKQEWESRKVRAFLALTFTCTLPIQGLLVALLYWDKVQAILPLFFFSPFVLLLGISLGLSIKVSKKNYKRVLNYFLIVIGLASFLAPFLPK